MSEPTSVTQSQIGFAPEVAPFAQDVLGQAKGLASLPYQAYTGDQVAGFSPLQQQSYDAAKQLTSSPQLQDATALAGQAGLGALNTQYTYKPSDFTSDEAQKYMSPYMQNVVDVQQQQAKRQAAIQNQALQAQAANAGAFGGGRQGIMNAQANAELQRNLQGIQATGLQNAFQNAQQQYNTQQQQNAQQQQFGASLGMQGLQLANQAASNLGALGQTQFAQNVGTIGLQNQMGLQQQQQAQNVLNTNYQNFLNQQNDPYKKLGFYSDIVRGAPLMNTGSSVYQSGPSGIQNLTSLGLGAYGLSSLFGNAPPKAAGGSIKEYAYGGSVLSDGFKEYAVGHIDPRQLPMAQRNAVARGDIPTAQYSQDEMAEDAALRKGIAGALPQGTNVVRAAGGGILAFARGGDTWRDYARQAQEAAAGPAELTPEQYTADIQSRATGMESLYGPNEVSPLMEEQQSRIGENLSQGERMAQAGMALRMAAALQKPGTTSGGRYAGAFEAAAEGGDKIQKLRDAASDQMFKAKLAGVQAKQAYRKGNVDQAIAAKAKADDFALKGRELQVRADDTAVQAAASIEREAMQNATQRALGNRPGETERMLAEINAIRSGKSSFAGKTGEEGVAAYNDALSGVGAARYGVRYTGQDKEAERLINALKSDNEYNLLKTKRSQLGVKEDLNAKQRGELTRIDTRIGEIEEAARQRIARAPGGSTGGTGGATVPLAAVQALRNNPERRNEFDAKYGRGAADRYLGE